MRGVIASLMWGFACSQGTGGLLTYMRLYFLGHFGPLFYRHKLWYYRLKNTWKPTLFVNTSRSISNQRNLSNSKENISNTFRHIPEVKGCRSWLENRMCAQTLESMGLYHTYTAFQECSVIGCSVGYLVSKNLWEHTCPQRGWPKIRWAHTKRTHRTWCGVHRCHLHQCFCYSCRDTHQVWAMQNPLHPPWSICHAWTANHPSYSSPFSLIHAWYLISSHLVLLSY